MGVHTAVTSQGAFHFSPVTFHGGTRCGLLSLLLLPSLGFAPSPSLPIAIAIAIVIAVSIIRPSDCPPNRSFCSDTDEPRAHRLPMAIF